MNKTNPKPGKLYRFDLKSQMTNKRYLTKFQNNKIYNVFHGDTVHPVQDNDVVMFVMHFNYKHDTVVLPPRAKYLDIIIMDFTNNMGWVYKEYGSNNFVRGGVFLVSPGKNIWVCSCDFEYFKEIKEDN